MSEMTISIVLYGEMDKYDTNGWLNFYNYAKNLSEKMSVEANYIGIIGEEFKSGKVLTMKRTEKRLLKSLNNGKTFSSVALYSLPNDFNQAAFDYNFYLGRDINEENQNTSQIILTFSEELYGTFDTTKIISELKEFMQFKEGQIFEMSRFECPMFYASKVNDPSSYKSLKVLSSSIS